VPFARDYSLGHGEILPRVLGAIPAPLPLAARSVFVEWLRGRLGLASPGAGAHGYAPAWGWAGGARRDAIPAEAVDVFARNLRSTVAVARAFGAKTLLVAQTARIRTERQAFDETYIESWSPGLTAGGYIEGLTRYSQAARSVANAEGATFVDPFADGAFTDQDFADPFHFSPAGSRKFALRLAGEIRGIREADATSAAANIR
jgi:lysophospholipase L1-like esterase